MDETRAERVSVLMVSHYSSCTVICTFADMMFSALDDITDVKNNEFVYVY